MAISYRKYPGRDQTHVLAVSDKSASTGTGPPQYPYAEMMVNHSYEEPNFNASRPAGKSWEWDERHGDYANEGNSPEPTELFHHTPAKISYAFSDPSLRHVVPTMVGIALRSAGNDKEMPMADDSLTNYSSRLSRKAVAKGLAVPHPDNPTMEGQADGYGFARRTLSHMDYFANRYPVPVEHEEVAGAKQWVRDTVRSASGMAPKRGTEPKMDDMHPVIQPAMFDFKGENYQVSEAAEGLTASGTRPGWTSMSKRVR